MSDELVNTLENLGLFFSGATGRSTRDYGELSGDNFQMMAMHTDPERLAKDLTSIGEAAARIRLLEQQLKTAREENGKLKEALQAKQDAIWTAAIEAAARVFDDRPIDANKAASAIRALTRPSDMVMVSVPSQQL